MASLLIAFPIPKIVFIMMNVIIVLILLLIIVLFRKINTLSNKVFTLQRSIDHRNTLLENSITQMAKDLPLENHPHTQNTQINNMIENLLHKFSIRLNKKIHDKFQLEQNIWHDKFSILLDLVGKTEKDLRQKRDEIFKDTWISITELRQKSQLLFNDMQEDGIFYRLQSLWLLGTVYHNQAEYIEAFRLCNAALKLVSEGQPKLPLSHKIIWSLVELFLNNEQHLDKYTQQNTLKKFQLTPQIIMEYCQELENFDSNIELLQQIRIWYNHHSNI